MNIKPKIFLQRGLGGGGEGVLLTVSTPATCSSSLGTSSCLFGSQRSIFIRDLYGTIGLIVDYHLWRASSSHRPDKAYYDGPQESHFEAPFLFCINVHCGPSGKTFLQSLRWRGILHQKVTLPFALQSIFSDQHISQYPPQAASVEEICLM